MRPTTRPRLSITAILICVAALRGAPARAGSTITVNTTNDSDSIDGELSLREALEAAGAGGLHCLTDAEKNQISGANFVLAAVTPSCSYNPFAESRWVFNGFDPNVGFGYHDVIVFAGGIGDTITVDPARSGSGLPELSPNDDIDGALPGGGKMRLLGTSFSSGSGVTGLRTTNAVGSQNSIRNLIVEGFSDHGIRVESQDSGTFQGLVIKGNAGTGLWLVGFAGNITNCQIGGSSVSDRNVITQNGGVGLRLDGFIDDAATGNRIEGNLIGTDGAAALGNGASGIFLAFAANNTIGGDAASQGNVISGNGVHGVDIFGTVSGGNTFKNNTIGLNAARNAKLPNGGDGIHTRSGAGTTSVGVNAAATLGNVIAGNNGSGIAFVGGSGNSVYKNFIGTNSVGAAGLGNGGAGVGLYGGTTGNAIGAVSTGVNVIMANAIGVEIADSGTSSNTAVANLIGHDNANHYAGNGVGVRIRNAATANTIGPSNSILKSAAEGIRIQDAGTNGNSIVGNTIGGSVGLAQGNGTNGVAIVDGASNTVGTPAQPNVVLGNGNDGVQISGGSASGNKVQGNVIGLDAAANFKVGNAFSGVAIFGGAHDNIVGGSGSSGNVIAGNGSNGVYIAGSGTNGNQVLGNKIGTNASGSAGLGNGAAGVTLYAGAANNSVGSAYPSNVIAGNGGPGVDLADAGTSGNTIKGNIIGLNPAGNAALANSIGIRLFGGTTLNTIGGPNASDTNVVSGNATGGIGLYNTGTSGNDVRGNTIGLNPANTAGLANAGNGVVIQEGASGNTVRENVIARNTQNGVFLQNAGTSGNFIQDNLIGTNAANASLGNTLHGLYLTNGAASSTVSGNVFAFNGGDGIYADSGTGNAFRGNAITSNGGLAIDLAPNGVTANDAGDGDTGPNDLQNFPVLTSAVRTCSNVTVQGTLNSNVSTSYNLDFFANPACDASGNGEAETYLGSIAVMTNGSGNTSFSTSLPFTPALGQTITATATSAMGNTSELSLCRTVTCTVPATPTAGNDGPKCFGATVQLSASTVSGATYAWTGPGGFTSSLQNPTITNFQVSKAGTYSVTVTVGCCTSASGTTNVALESTAPTVTPPSASTVTQTICS